MVEARRLLVQELYTPLHPHLYVFNEVRLIPIAHHDPKLIQAFRLMKDVLDPAFLSAIVRGSDEDLQNISTKHEEGLYSMPVFTPKFCK